MKIILALILSFALLGAFALPGLAADVTWRMTHGDDFQDALLRGHRADRGCGWAWDRVFDRPQKAQAQPVGTL